MAFYHRTLHQASSITHSVIGNFLDTEKEDIIVSTGRILKLLRFKLDDTRSEIQTLISVDTYDIICSLSKFRKKDQPKDWIVIAADSGTISILTIDSEKMEFGVVVQNKFEVHTPKTLPALHLAVHSQGHVISTAAMEEVKQFWFFQAPEYRVLEILEDLDKKTVIYDIAFVDTSENIVVAYLATVYDEIHPGTKWELRKRYRPWVIFKEVNKDGKVTERNRLKCLDLAHSLISVPGQRGVLVCAEDFISFYSVDSSEIIRCSIPKRIMDPKAGVIFGCSTKCSLKVFQKIDVSFGSSPQSSIYYLAQTEEGDIFRIQLVVNELGVNEIVLKYFITLPVASALCTFESGFLFLASEFGDHHIYRIADIENRARVHPWFSSAMNLPSDKPFLFLHRSLNIASVAEIKSLSPIMHMEFEPLSRERFRMCLAVGRADLSALKISKVQSDVSYQYRATIETDEIPLRMWVIKSTTTTESLYAESKELIVVSFEASTAVYSQENLSENVMKEMTNLPFAKETNTVGCAKTGEDAIVQVCPEGICLIRNGKNQLIHQTKEEDEIQECAFNKYSLIIACENKELKHHKIDQNGCVMRSKIARLVNGPVTCILFSDKDESSQLLAVGSSIPPAKYGSKVIAGVNEVNLFVIGLTGINLVHMLKVENSPYSLIFMNGVSNLQSLLVGCENGVLMTLAVEEKSGTEGEIEHELKVIKTEETGSKPVQLLPARVVGKEQVGYGILAISNQTWFKESIDGEFLPLKLDISPCICAMPESESIVTILEDKLGIFVLEDLLLPITIPLKYTPKKFVVDSATGNFFIIEADFNSYTEETKELKRLEFEERRKAPIEKRPLNLSAFENIPKSKSWASLLRVVNITGENVREVFKFPFVQDEAAWSLCLFKQGKDNLLLVGVAKQIKHASGQWWCKGASIHTYRILNQGETIELLHKTVVKSAPTAMCNYEGNVLIGIGRKLALYCVVPESLELVLVCEKKDCVSTSITAIYPIDKRILVCDSEFGTSYVVYDLNAGGSLHLLKEDVFPIEVTAACILSGNRMARAARSRSIFIVELGTVEDKDMNLIFNDEEPPFTLSEEKLLNCFHVGEIVTSMQIFNLLPGSLVYTTLSGSIGIFSWQEDAEFLSSLYTTLFKLSEEIDKSRHLLPIFPNAKLRSRFYQRKNVIDGDFLDEFLKLEVGFQKTIANKLFGCEEMEEEGIAEILSELEKIRRETMLDFQF